MPQGGDAHLGRLVGQPGAELVGRLVDALEQALEDGQAGRKAGQRLHLLAGQAQAVEFQRRRSRVVADEGVLAAQKVLELGVQVRLGGQAVDVDAAEQDGERQPVDVQHAARHAAVDDLEQVRGDDGQPLAVVRHVLEARVVVQHRVEDVQEEVQRVLVQKVHLCVDNNRSPGLLCVLAVTLMTATSSGQGIGFTWLSESRVK